MAEKIKQSWFKEQIRKFIMGFQLLSSLILGIFIIIVLYFAMNYYIAPAYTPEQVLDAQKIGNWEMPDGKYILKNVENLSVAGKTIGAVTVKDAQTGNMLMVFDVPFDQTDILKVRDSVQRQIFEKYNLEKYYPKSSQSGIGPIGKEFVYIMAGWGSGDNAQAGIIGSLDCLGKKKVGSIIMAVGYNSFAKFDAARALAFFGTIKCPAGSDNGDGEVDTGENLVDTDGDGLTDKVEKMLGTDPYKKDTDGDGFDDFIEIQTGHNPMIVRPWDEYTPEDFAKVKKDIRYVSIKVYDRLFPEN